MNLRIIINDLDEKDIRDIEMMLYEMKYLFEDNHNNKYGRVLTFKIKELDELLLMTNQFAKYNLSLELMLYDKFTNCLITKINFAG